jgi:hypothetical protein
MITAADIQTIRDADPGAILPGIDTMNGRLERRPWSRLALRPQNLGKTKR